MRRQNFAERIQQGPLLLDGAMGTVLHSKGIPFDHGFDALTCEDPAIVAEVHRQYIDAGADIIETNTFGANRFKLAENGLANQVQQINQAAVTVARRVIEGSYKAVLLAGSVGPLGVRLAPLGRVTMSQAEEAFEEQIGALVAEPGVDLLILETMSDTREMKAAVTAARRLAPDIPIIAQMTFTRDDRTILGDTPAEVARRLSELDVDVIGVNCSGGPVQVLRLITIMNKVGGGLPLAASPNAGWPEQTEGGRVLYPAGSTYFADYARSFLAAGVSLIGGCCGTTAAHIAAMRQAIDTPGEQKRPLPEVTVVMREGGPAKTPVDRPTLLAQTLAQGKLVVTVEMSPPKGIATQKMLAGAHMLKEAGADFIDVADSPLARMRMSAWAASYLLQQEVGVETILHFPTRGRNLLRVQGDLLAAYALNVRNLFVTMGDPTRIGDYPEAMDSYDIVPTGLIQLIKQQFNSGLDKAGQSIDEPTNFVVGCAVSLTPKDPERELKLLRKKVRNGADFALTQPVFDPAAARAFISMYEATYGEPILPLIAGIKPLYNSGNAEFLHNEVPGIIIPDVYRARMAAAANPQTEGVRIAQEILAEIRPVVQGVYMIPSFGRYNLVADVLDVLRES